MQDNIERLANVIKQLSPLSLRLCTLTGYNRLLWKILIFMRGTSHGWNFKEKKTAYYWGLPFCGWRAIFLNGSSLVIGNLNDIWKWDPMKIIGILQYVMTINEPVKAFPIHSDDDPAVWQTFVFCFKLLHILKLAFRHFCRGSL